MFTRRPKVQFSKTRSLRYGAIALAGCASLFLVSCGGSGGAGGSGGFGSGTGNSAAGMVVLPAKFPLPITQLAVSTEEGQVPVTSSGAFSAHVSSSGPRIIQLIDTKTNKIVMLGFADSASSGSLYAGGHGQISAASTADALLFIGLEGGAFPSDQWTNFLTLIHGSTQEGQVASVIATSVAANPTAISDGDAPIQNAVGAIQASYSPPADIPETTSVQHVIVTQSTSGALINVSPTTPQSTLVITPNPTGDGIVAVSHSRRRCVLFVYEVATGPSANNLTPLTQIKEVASDVDVEPEREIGQFFTSIAEGLQGHFAYLPVTSPPIDLPADPVQEVAAYDVVAIGPGSIDTASQVEKMVAPNSQAEQATLSAEWLSASTHVYLSVVCKDIFIPTLLELLMGAGEAQSAAGDSDTDTEVENIAESLPDVASAISARNIKGALSTFTADIQANVDGAKSQVIAALARTFVSSGAVSAATFQTALQRMGSAVSVIGIINKGLLVADISQAVHDNYVYDDADGWVADVLQPKVTLSPAAATINSENNIANFQTVIQNESDLSQFRFQWSTTGTEGHLEEPNSSTLMPSGPTTFSGVTYVADLLKLKTGTTDTITVTVFSASDLSTPIGAATASATDGVGLETSTVTFDGTTTYTAPQNSNTGASWNESNVTSFSLVPGATSYVIHPLLGTNTASASLSGFWRYNSKTGVLTIDGLHGELIPWPAFTASGGGLTIALDGENSATDPTGALLPLYALQRQGVVVDISYQ